MTADLLPPPRPRKGGRVPKISEFYGISIYIYYRDHAPPHFHAIYSGWEAEVGIVSGKLMEGSLPPAARRMVRLWATEHREQLLENWQRARSGREPLPVAPLE